MPFFDTLLLVVLSANGWLLLRLVHAVHRLSDGLSQLDANVYGVTHSAARVADALAEGLTAIVLEPDEGEDAHDA